MNYLQINLSPDLETVSGLPLSRTNIFTKHTVTENIPFWIKHIYGLVCTIYLSHIVANKLSNFICLTNW